MPAKQQEKKKRGRPAGKPESRPKQALSLAPDTPAPVRDASGRFVKGQSGNPGGRAGIPQEIRDAARIAPHRLLELAEDPSTPPRVKADIYKWMAEMVLGKPRQQVDMEAQVESKSIIVELAGDLASWGE